MVYPKISSLKTCEKLSARLSELHLQLPLDAEMVLGDAAPLAQPLAWRSRLIGNRFAILPMEGWDGTRDGQPSALTMRRWRRFGESGAKLIWGGRQLPCAGRVERILINYSLMMPIYRA